MSTLPVARYPGTEADLHLLIVAVLHQCAGPPCGLDGPCPNCRQLADQSALNHYAYLAHLRARLMAEEAEPREETERP